jgi:hypothetical protein
MLSRSICKRSSNRVCTERAARCEKVNVDKRRVVEARRRREAAEI